ncbi:MAG: FAD-binding oxidoreductase [Nitratireductor sp.]
MSLDPHLLKRFGEIVGHRNALAAPLDLSRYTVENRGLFPGTTPLVLKPGSTGEVAAIVKLAAETGTALVPQGGNTGHAAGATPDMSGEQIVVSMERMNAIREIDVAGATMTVEAGVILQVIQQRAEENNLLFPLSLASQGSCQIGGNISTNAGGTAVLAFGSTRDLVLGLEVVLPDGNVWNGLRKLKKDNTGYSLRNLFIGGEGTLGIVTAAVLKLFPRPAGREVAFAGVESPEKALALLNLAQRIGGNALTSFELMPRIGIEFVLRHGNGQRDPLESPYPWYVLAEVSSGRSQEDASGLAEGIFGEAIEVGLVKDAVIAGSIARQRELWAIRETLPGAQKPEGGSIKHDISVPVHAVPEFLERAGKIVERELPGSRVVAFGHMGDGNIHYNISQPEGADTAEFMTNRLAINDAIHALVLSMDGSISAEHGIGQMKRDMLAATKSSEELELMRRIKAAIDPRGIMNPGKML